MERAHADRRHLPLAGPFNHKDAADDAEGHCKQREFYAS